MNKNELSQRRKEGNAVIDQLVRHYMEQEMEHYMLIVAVDEEGVVTFNSNMVPEMALASMKSIMEAFAARIIEEANHNEEDQRTIN